MNGVDNAFYIWIPLHSAMDFKTAALNKLSCLLDSLSV